MTEIPKFITKDLAINIPEDFKYGRDAMDALMGSQIDKGVRVIINCPSDLMDRPDTNQEQPK